jgi:hypothetical protein
MESYVFKTSCGTIGFFQKNEDVCRLYLDEEFWPKNNLFSWKNWIQYSGKSGTPTFLSKA